MPESKAECLESCVYECGWACRVVHGGHAPMLSTIKHAPGCPNAEAKSPNQGRTGPNHAENCVGCWHHSGKGYNRVRVCSCGAEDHDPEPQAEEPNHVQADNYSRGVLHEYEQTQPWTINLARAYLSLAATLKERDSEWSKAVGINPPVEPWEARQTLELANQHQSKLLKERDEEIAKLMTVGGIAENAALRGRVDELGGALKEIVRCEDLIENQAVQMYDLDKEIELKRAVESARAILSARAASKAEGKE